MVSAELAGRGVPLRPHRQRFMLILLSPAKGECFFIACSLTMPHLHTSYALDVSIPYSPHDQDETQNNFIASDVFLASLVLSTVVVSHLGRPQRLQRSPAIFLVVL